MKNNLQVISSLLSLQAGAINDPRLRTLFEASQHRIHAMALVHDLLQQADDVARINLGQYAARLIEEVAHTYAITPERITLEAALENVWVVLDTATPCGILLHELLANCVKHAFPAGRSGAIRVAVGADAGQVTLAVADDGVGCPAAADVRWADALEVQLIELLTEQLGGTLTCEGHGGTTVTVRFPGPGGRLRASSGAPPRQSPVPR